MEAGRLVRFMGLRRMLLAPFLVLVALYIFFEAYHRFGNPPEVKAGWMLGVAIVGLAANLFSAFMLYDLKQVMDGGETNYIMATLEIYLDVYNVFTNLLALLGIVGGNRE